MEASDTVLEIANTFCEEVQTNGPITDWVTSEFVHHQCDCHALKMSSQILCNGVSPLKAQVTQAGGLPGVTVWKSSARPSVHHSQRRY